MRTPWLHRAMMVTMFIALLTFTLNYVLGWFFEVHPFLALLTALLLLAAGYLIWRQGYQPGTAAVLAYRQPRWEAVERSAV